MRVDARATARAADQKGPGDCPTTGLFTLPNFIGVAPFNLANAMSKLLALGVSLNDVVATITSNRAKMPGLPETLGTIAKGRVADVSVLKLREGAFELADNSAVTKTARRMLSPLFCLRAGERFDATSPFVPRAVELAAA